MDRCSTPRPLDFLELFVAARELVQISVQRSMVVPHSGNLEKRSIGDDRTKSDPARADGEIPQRTPQRRKPFVESLEVAQDVVPNENRWADVIRDEFVFRECVDGLGWKARKRRIAQYGIELLDQLVRKAEARGLMKAK